MSSGGPRPRWLAPRLPRRPRCRRGVALMSRGGDLFVVGSSGRSSSWRRDRPVGAFALHETAHVMALSRVATVTQIAMERTLLRVSVAPSGSDTRTGGRRVLIGPLSHRGRGRAPVLAPQSSLGWWSLPTPSSCYPSGDGRALVGAARAARAAGSAKQVPSVGPRPPPPTPGPREQARAEPNGAERSREAEHAAALALCASPVTRLVTGLADGGSAGSAGPCVASLESATLVLREATPGHRRPARSRGPT